MSHMEGLKNNQKNPQEVIIKMKLLKSKFPDTVLSRVF